MSTVTQLACCIPVMVLWLGPLAAALLYGAYTGCCSATKRLRGRATH